MLARILNTFGTRGLSAVINFIIAIVVSQYLGPDGKGEQGIILATIAFVLVFSNLVGGATLVYLIPRHHFSLLLIPSYFWSIATSGIAWAVLHAFDIVKPEFITHICLLSVLNGFTNIHSTMLIGKEKIKASNLVSLVQPMIVIISLLIYFSVSEKQSIDAYIHALYYAFGGSLVVSMFYLNKYFERIKIYPLYAYLKVVRELFRLGFMNQLAHITQMMSFRLSYYFLEVFQGEASVGIYSNGIQIMESIWLISKSISLVQYARIANSDDIRYAQTLSVQLLKAGLYISMLSIIPLLILPESFYLFIFGEGFAGVKSVIWILAPGVLVYNFSIILGHYFSGLGKYYVNTIASTIGLLVSILMFYWLIPPYSTVGASIATSLSYLVTSLVILIFFFREAGTKRSDFLPKRSDLAPLRALLKK
ncbi:MAG TPA: polysaccharide biosynthesis C-terminal domain-containing protein [Bacteroidales bacterium]|nr:polysaccharide biosynthesis C-terminal domain-containing protein [Bacteroidales bacterium]